MEFDEDLMIPDKTLSFNEGCVNCMGWMNSKDPGSYSHALLEALAKKYKFSLDTPYEKLPEKARDIFIHGTGGEAVKVHYKGQRSEGVYEDAFEGLIKNMERRYRETFSDSAKAEYEQYMRISPCETCKGQRLKKESLAVTVDDKNIFELTEMSVKQLLKYFDTIPESITEQQQRIGTQIIKEIHSRIRFMNDVGLDYLTLSRATGTLSGGEAQRIRLATQIGSGLVGVAYILDEPSIGLHQRDNDKLLATLRHLRDLGNTLIVVEHDEDTMLAADHIIDIGPGAGIHGGELVAEGTADEISKVKESITGRYLSGRAVHTRAERDGSLRGWIEIRKARENNLKNIDVKIPLGVMTIVTGYPDRESPL